MSNDIETIFLDICEIVREDPLCKTYSKPGMCRKWSYRVISILRNKKIKNIKIACSAREVCFDNYLYHTFIRIKIQQGNRSNTFLMDGTGIANHDKYFGEEKKAPKYLRNSTSDQINAYANK